MKPGWQTMKNQASQAHTAQRTEECRIAKEATGIVPWRKRYCYRVKRSWAMLGVGGKWLTGIPDSCCRLIMTFHGCSPSCAQSQTSALSTPAFERHARCRTSFCHGLPPDAPALNLLPWRLLLTIAHETPPPPRLLRPTFPRTRQHCFQAH